MSHFFLRPKLFTVFLCIYILNFISFSLISFYLKMEVKIRLNNTKLGITTVWSLQKFEAKLMQMREVYQVKQVVTYLNV